ncbi:sensor histidine kinase [Siculibacillus lacustris]|nr:PocR ligand-binding domain-containing protein [Siculibacillus lacustris]
MMPLSRSLRDLGEGRERAAVVSTLRIEDIVDLPKLQRIQDTFAKAMGVAAVTVDQAGVPVTKESNFQSICRMIRSQPEGLRRCRSCDAAGGMAAFESGRTATYVCSSGLVDAAAPIIIEGEYLGCILCGQVTLIDDREARLEDIVRRVEILGLDHEAVVKAARATPVIARERFDSAVEMLMLTASHIVEVGMTNLAQRRLLQESAEKSAVETSLRDAQLQALQARMNPHFIFNSLTLICYTAFEEHAAKTEEIAYTLSDLLRYSLRNTATTVPLGEEFDMIERCLALHKLRFGDQLTKYLDLEEDLKDTPVPCMILQPIVENAIVHGVESLARPATVRVSAHRKGGRVVLEVFDDGVGMSPEQVRALNDNRILPPIPGRKRPALGLQSVITRLENEFGSRFALAVESGEGKGTLIRLSWTT